jgi:hypothetical protein
VLLGRRDLDARPQQSRLRPRQEVRLDEVRIGRADTNSILGVLPQSTVAGKTGSASAATVVSVGKKLTRDLHLTYEQGWRTRGRAQDHWTITQHFQLLARAGLPAGTGRGLPLDFQMKRGALRTAHGHPAAHG